LILNADNNNDNSCWKQQATMNKELKQCSEGNEGGQRNQCYAAHNKKLQPTNLSMSKKQHLTGSPPCDDFDTTFGYNVAANSTTSNKKTPSKPWQSIGGNISWMTPTTTRRMRMWRHGVSAATWQWQQEQPGLFITSSSRYTKQQQPGTTTNDNDAQDNDNDKNVSFPETTMTTKTMTKHHFAWTHHDSKSSSSSKSNNSQRKASVIMPLLPSLPSQWYGQCWWNANDSTHGSLVIVAVGLLIPGRYTIDATTQCCQCCQCLGDPLHLGIVTHHDHDEQPWVLKRLWLCCCYCCCSCSMTAAQQRACHHPHHYPQLWTWLVARHGPPCKLLKQSTSSRSIGKTATTGCSSTIK